MNAREHLKAAPVSMLAALAWAVLAWRTPTSTHHFAPLVIGGGWAYLIGQAAMPVPKTDRGIAAAGGVLVALLTFTVLTVTGKLDGPPLISAIPVMAELPIMALIGAVVGTGLLRRRKAISADHP